MTESKFHGRIFRFGDDINTDYIISAKHKSLILDHQQLAKHLMEDIRPGFYDELQGGDILAAGENFGCGSSRETAPIVIKEAGVAAVVAKSFGRIFYRNAINIGLPLVICNTDGMREGDGLEIDLEEGYVQMDGCQERIAIAPYPEQVKQIMALGGVKEWLIAAGYVPAKTE